MSIELVTCLMFGSLALALLLNIPLAFATGGVAILFSFFLWGPASLALLPKDIFVWMGSYLIVATAMFIFMGTLLARSGIADDLFEAIHHWLPIRGGLAIASVVVCTIMGAMIGVAGGSVVAMGIIAIPAMLKRNYDRKLAMGTIMGAGPLGLLIPPSTMMIWYGMVSQLSVGKLFLGGVGPGLLSALLFIGYIVLRSLFQPSLAPAPTREERSIPLKKKFGLLKNLILPIFIIFSVLGTIMLGIATPVEASGVGCLATIIACAIVGRLDWAMLRRTCYETMRIVAMLLWIVFGASLFTKVYTGIGGVEFIKNFLIVLPVTPWVILGGMIFVLIVLGMFLDWLGILILAAPIFLPVAKSFGFFGLDPLAFGVIFVISLVMSYTTPPFGYSFFYIKGVVSKEIGMDEIYRAGIPFAFLQLAALIICVFIPEIMVWLPNKVIG